MKEYNDNIQELKLKKIQLTKFKNEREAIISKYTKTTVSGSPKIIYKRVYDKFKKKWIRKPFIEENLDIKGKNKKQEPMLDLQIELEESRVDLEIKRLENEIEELDAIIREMREPLRHLKGYAKRVYLYQLEGLSKTKAVEKVAEEDNISDRNIWRQLRKKVK